MHISLVRAQTRAILDLGSFELEDVIRAFAEAKTDQHILEFLPKGGFECIERKDADAANAEIARPLTGCASSSAAVSRTCFAAANSLSTSSRRAFTCR